MPFLQFYTSTGPRAVGTAAGEPRPAIAPSDTYPRPGRMILRDHSFPRSAPPGAALTDDHFRFGRYTSVAVPSWTSLAKATVSLSVGWG